MKTIKKVQQDNKGLILAFQISRGGHLTYLGEKKIGEFTNNLFARYENEADFCGRFGWDNTFSDQKSITDLMTDKNFDQLEAKFGISEEDLGEEIYYHENGNEVGLTVSEGEAGVGTIEIDGIHDTVYTVLAEDLAQHQIDAINDTADEIGYLGAFAEEITEAMDEDQ